MADVYLSYAPQDKIKAEQIARALTQSGRSVWWDSRIQAEGQFQGSIEEQLEQAKCVVVLWSRHARDAPWVLEEGITARERGNLLPVLIEPVHLTLSFQASHPVDLSHWTGDFQATEFAELLEAVEQLVSGKLVREVTPAWSSGQPLVRTSPDETESAIRLPTSKETPSANPPPEIFLCYRRDDSPGEAGRLHDRLVDVFGAAKVFMDIASVPLGIDFVDHVSAQISQCKAVVVMIGRQWLKIKDKSRRRRLDDPNDLVRAEIAAALRQKIPVIPVLIQNATMPTATDLPEDICLLARRNGIALRHEQWREGVERLLRELNPVMGRKE